MELSSSARAVSTHPEDDEDDARTRLDSRATSVAGPAAADDDVEG